MTNFTYNVNLNNSWIVTSFFQNDVLKKYLVQYLKKNFLKNFHRIFLFVTSFLNKIFGMVQNVKKILFNNVIEEF